MNDSHFDEFSKRLAGTTSRRQALRLFAAAGGAGVLSLLGVSTAGAVGRCKKEGQQCRESLECCSKFCDPATSTCAPCPPGTVACGGQCVPACTPPRVLNTNTCSCECPNGTAPCGNTCCSQFDVCCSSTSSCCPSGTTCCAGNCCTSVQTCQNGTCCVPQGGPCTSSSDCCSGSGLTCVGAIKGQPGICVPFKK
jgi:hypothetical protein